MTRKVERISPIRGARMDAEGSLHQRQGFAGDGGAFGRTLHRELQKNKKIVPDSGADVPYVVDVTRATQSLFYHDSSFITRVGKYLSEARP